MSRKDSSYDDPRLRQGIALITAVVLILAGGIYLIVRGLF
jgi:hypothetical protein